MKQSLLNKLGELVERHVDLEHSLADPDVIADQQIFRRYSQEYAQLEPVARDYKAYHDVKDEIASLEEMQQADEAELRDMAAAELADCETRAQALETRLYKHLIPVDPQDQANIYLEIRAGTGGDEAALF